MTLPETTLNGPTDHKWWMTYMKKFREMRRYAAQKNMDYGSSQDDHPGENEERDRCDSSSYYEESDDENIDDPYEDESRSNGASGKFASMAQLYHTNQPNVQHHEISYTPHDAGCQHMTHNPQYPTWFPYHHYSKNGLYHCRQSIQALNPSISDNNGFPPPELNFHHNPYEFFTRSLDEGNDASSSHLIYTPYSHDLASGSSDFSLHHHHNYHPDSDYPVPETSSSEVSVSSLSSDSYNSCESSPIPEPIDYSIRKGENDQSVYW